MYTCTCCGKKCNRTTNIFITNNFCDECLDLFYKGELGKKKKDKGDENGKKE